MGHELFWYSISGFYESPWATLRNGRLFGWDENSILEKKLEFLIDNSLVSRDQSVKDIFRFPQFQSPWAMQSRLYVMILNASIILVHGSWSITVYDKLNTSDFASSFAFDGSIQNKNKNKKTKKTSWIILIMKGRILRATIVLWCLCVH